jgi:hypothetical protein
MLALEDDGPESGARDGDHRLRWGTPDPRHPARFARRSKGTVSCFTLSTLTVAN